MLLRKGLAQLLPIG
ncbi:hypothetical protein LINGRAHAP2_LOCUS12527 [Linum grandiflorum]